MTNTQPKSTRGSRSRLADTAALVIGGTSGVGFGVAEALIEQGVARLYLSSSNAAKVARAETRLRGAFPNSPVTITGLVCDLGDEATLEHEVARLFAAIDSPLDHIVYTAGDSLGMKLLADVDLDFFRRCGMVRFFAPLLVARHAASRLVPGAASSITLTTGAVAEHPLPDWSVIASYAAGLAGMTRALALELRPARVNLVQLGAVDTEMWDATFPSPEARAAAMRDFAAKTASGVVGSVEDVVETYLYAMKNVNATGTVIRSDGGIFIVPQAAAADRVPNP